MSLSLSLPLSLSLVFVYVSLLVFYLYLCINLHDGCSINFTGVMFGNPEVTSGGNALKFYSSVRVDVRKIEILKENLGVRVRVKIVKNKVQ